MEIHYILVISENNLLDLVSKCKGKRGAVYTMREADVDINS